MNKRLQARGAKKRADFEEEQPIVQLVDIIDKDIETIVNMRLRAEREVSWHQRFIERVTGNVGRPRFFYLLLCFVALWVIINAAAVSIHIPTIDAPPFTWLELIVSCGSLILTTVVLITQNRQEKMAEQRRHLDLQINLLVEHKVTKVIDLLEELRRDLPIVENREDPQARAMMETVDPHSVLQSLNETFEQAIQEIE